MRISISIISIVFASMLFIGQAYAQATNNVVIVGEDQIVCSQASKTFAGKSYKTINFNDVEQEIIDYFMGQESQESILFPAVWKERAVICSFEAKLGVARSIIKGIKQSLAAGTDTDKIAKKAAELANFTALDEFNSLMDAELKRTAEDNPFHSVLSKTKSLMTEIVEGASSEKVSELMSQIESVAGKLNLQLTDLKSQTRYKATYPSIAVTIDSSFVDILHLLYDLQNDPYYFDVEELRIDKSSRRVAALHKLRLVLNKKSGSSAQKIAFLKNMKPFSSYKGIVEQRDVFKAPWEKLSDTDTSSSNDDPNEIILNRDDIILGGEKLKGSVFVPGFLSQVQSMAPASVSFRSVVLGEKGNFTVQGYSKDGASVNDFRIALQESEYFREVTLEFSTKRRIFNMDVTDFKISAEVNL